MDYLIYVLVICISAPLFQMMVLAESKTRMMLGFMIMGMVISVISAEVNTMLKIFFEGTMDFFHLTTSVTPLSEEILKAIPLLVVAVFVTDKRNVLLIQAMSIGIGFAVMENTFILLQNVENVSLLWAVIRGFASGLMHSLCTLVVGVGISMIRKQKKIFITGTFALLVTAATYHSLFNMLVQSKYMYIGAFLPIVTYICLTIIANVRKWNKVNK